MIFFFKQKTAYEMRISDWSSDVCSSDLGYVLRDLFEDDSGGWLQDVALLDRLVDETLKAEGARIGEEGWKWVAVAVDFPYTYDDGMRVIDGEQPPLTDEDEAKLAALREEADRLENEWSGQADIPRSEEHTSELQSLMRNSHAGFCLK